MAELTAIIAAVKQHPRTFDFTKDTLGESLCHVTAMAIIAFMGSEIDPDGNPWPELSEAYADWKSTVAAGEPMAVLYRHMRTLDQMEGLHRITATTVDQTYGTDEEARSLAEWFQEGSTKQNRPPRPFYAFNDLAINNLNDWCDQHFAAAFR
ncbi:MAG: hypothetical protein P4L84_34985 [Isosphaeraceae bacterium]|nr:hypothetical protein [Isosphaeraceae bacterium]